MSFVHPVSEKLLEGCLLCDLLRQNRGSLVVAHRVVLIVNAAGARWSCDGHIVAHIFVQPVSRHIVDVDER